MPNLKRDSRIKSEHLSSESIEILRLLNNYSVQIAPQHSPHDDTDELVWRSEWPFFIEGHGVNNLLRYIGFIESDEASKEPLND